MSSSPKPTRLYTFKRIFFSLLVVGNLLGCIAFALLEAYINNNFRAVWYSASKPIDTTTEAFIIAIAVVGVLFHLFGLYGSHREHLLVTKLYGGLTLVALAYALYRAVRAPIFLVGALWYSTAGFCLLTTVSTVWFALDLQLVKSPKSKLPSYLK